MSDLRRRLRKLEATFTDRSGLVPHSPPWKEYWMNECHRTFDEGEVPKKAIPLEAIRAWMQAQPDTE